MERSRRTGWALIGIIVALGLTLTACGGRPAPGRSATSYAATSYAAASRSGPPHGSRAASRALASKMLGQLGLPPGSRVVRPDPVPRYLRQPAQGLGVPYRVDVTRFYSAPQTMHAAYSYLRRHVPAGYRLGVTGSEGNSRGTAERIVGYSPKSMPRGVSDADLVVGVVSGRHGGSVLRADGEAGWFPPRSAAEHLRAAGYRAVTITRGALSSRQTTRTFRSRAAIARLARVLNSRPAANGGPVSCPPEAPFYHLVFRPARGHPRFAVTTFGCSTDRVVAAGRVQPPLWDPYGRVAAAAHRLVRHRAG